MSDPHVRAMFKLKHLHVPCLQVWPPPHLLWLAHTRDWPTPLPHGQRMRPVVVPS
jgi:hypothetical protein